ncbi:hypothetical protein C8N35_102112 [Breoghania corrubedonensis]|uniref:Uncharacterized protein n=1 Tax=Breoghania corrubedonensis TaxID=665038 RepID=A0A2T5VCB5_9HYPH|nr:hypothetical protein [Breoghania corrubedonensis]PTW61403.1 hypothetical protein C8N35_102112 [Breoghania corrubedonensis]
MTETSVTGDRAADVAAIIEGVFCTVDLPLNDQLGILTALLAKRIAAIGSDAQVRNVAAGATDIITRSVERRLAEKRGMLS